VPAGEHGVKAALRDVAFAYRRMSRYAFYAFLACGLVLTIAQTFAQSPSDQVQLSIFNAQCREAGVQGIDAWYTCTAKIIINTQFSQVWLNGNLTYYDPGFKSFQSSSLYFSSNNPINIASGSATVTARGDTFDTSDSNITMYVWAYDPNNPSHIYATAAAPINATSGNVSNPQSGNLFILNIELPLFQVPQLGLSAANKDFANLFGSFDQLPLGGFYLLLAEIALIILAGAGIVNFILYLSNGANGEGRNGAKTLAGLSNLLTTVIIILLLPYAYNAVAGFVNTLDQMIIAGPDNIGSYSTAYLNNLQSVWNNLPSGGNIFTDLVGAIASILVWVFTWLMGSARLFLLGSMIVAMPIVLVLRDIKFTSRFAGTIEETFYGLIFASVVSALFIGLAAYLFNYWDGSIFATAGVNKNWVALAALLGAIFVPMVFAPMTGFFFQTMAQTGMAAAGTALAIAGSAAGPLGGGVTAGAGSAGQALKGLAQMAQSAGKAPTFGQQLSTALKGFGSGFLPSIPHALKNMAIIGTAGTLGAAGASQAAKAITATFPTSTAADVHHTVHAQEAKRIIQKHLPRLTSDDAHYTAVHRTITAFLDVGGDRRKLEQELEKFKDNVKPKKYEKLVKKLRTLVAHYKDKP
jgi:hypothetical protein